MLDHVNDSGLILAVCKVARTRFRMPLSHSSNASMAALYGSLLALAFRSCCSWITHDGAHQTATVAWLDMLCYPSVNGNFHQLE
jgi:hypothetical protein